MTPKAISQLLDELNKTHFKGGFKIEYHKGDKNSWGPHVWMLKYPSKENNVDWGSRICWLNTSRSFEMRHGGGSDFIWWVDSLILANIAVYFNGRISDDALEGTWSGKPDEINTFTKYMQRRVNHIKNQNWLLQLTLEVTPPEFHDELKEMLR